MASPAKDAAIASVASRKSGAIEQHRRDVLEHDARLWKVGHVADRGGDAQCDIEHDSHRMIVKGCGSDSAWFEVIS